MKINSLIKDKNKLLMLIPLILGILFIYVFFIHETQGKEGTVSEEKGEDILSIITDKSTRHYFL